MDLEEIGWGGMDWISLDQDGDQWSECSNERSWSIKFWNFLSVCTTSGLLSIAQLHRVS
jgi:hypothetical protein